MKYALEPWFSFFYNSSRKRLKKFCIDGGQLRFDTNIPKTAHCEKYKQYGDCGSSSKIDFIFISAKSFCKNYQDVENYEEYCFVGNDYL